MIRNLLVCSAAGLTFAVAGCAVRDAADESTLTGEPVAAVRDIAALEKAVPDNPLRDAFFGETHVHSSYSLDSYIGGNRNGPEQIYAFARGGEMTINGQPHRLSRPLDFAAVSDHAENIGEMYSAQNPGAPGYDNPLLTELRGLQTIAEQRDWFVKYVVSNNRSDKPQHPTFYAGPRTTRSAWMRNREVTERYYEPGTFTTLHAFEWSAAPGGGNMHRNVFFRDANVPDLPFSAIDSNDEEELWQWIAQQRGEGRSLFAIPHNSNGSKTRMFEPVDNSGTPLTADYAQLRASMEPLIEMMQIKGNSEVHRRFWPNDEFADFENADSMGQFSGRVPDERNFVRYALKEGVRYRQSIGANPFQFGFVGGSDNHNSGAGDVSEEGYIGSHGAADATLEERRKGVIDGWIAAPDSNPGALTGVWARKNTRAAIWDAMMARETFATSGTRMKVRMFAGTRLARPGNALELVRHGYRDGTPMGGTLKDLSGVPAFTVWAAKDPDGANLDRVQIIKGWVDAAGETHEKVYDVVWSGKRAIGPDGKLPAVGSTVDLARASYTNAIGSPELMAWWRDPDWQRGQLAFYYVRAIEIPTPRWTTYDAVAAGMGLLDDYPATVQERAWGSPIWYIGT